MAPDSDFGTALAACLAFSSPLQRIGWIDAFCVAGIRAPAQPCGYYHPYQIASIRFFHVQIALIHLYVIQLERFDCCIVVENIIKWLDGSTG